ncbi:MAG TPA: NADH-quinone oxidoreductase subunit H [candidate division Zixibacteria bacterium]|nr:NADH-quinone oxidoreductase subunit H [candidate division Zixibacteria bacterium]
MQAFYYLIFPGFLFAAVVGLLTTWLDRKVTARVHYRVGPPWFQSFADVMKLMGKEVILPENARKTGFLLAPIIALAASTLVATMLGLANYLNQGFVGDIIVFWYFLAVPSIMIIIGSASAGTPLSAVGSSREMKLLLGYEVPFIIVLAMVIFRADSLSLGGIIEHQIESGPILYSLSGVIGFIVALLCVQAKLGLVPFDAPEAETELGGGAFYDYSGAALGGFKLSKAILFYSLPIFLITLFWGGVQIGGGLGILWALLKYILIVALITVIRNTNPRLRIDQAVKFFWGWMTILAVIAFILRVKGL